MGIKPECRACGTRVEYFGDLCSPCSGDGAAGAPDELARLDSFAMQSRMAAEDY